MTAQPGRLKREWKKVLSGLLGAALAADMLVNGLLGGDVNETISSRAGRMAREGSYVAIGLCVVLDVIDDNHCEDAADNKGG